MPIFSFKERAILCSKNDDVMSINQQVSDKVTGSKVVLYSEDKARYDASDGEEGMKFPPEYLHTQNLAGLSPHQLELKVGLPVMLLRNLDPSRGLYNGTRLKILRIGQYVLVTSILGDGNDDRIELIPRFTLSTLNGQRPFILTRKQFPVRVSFVMTINKSQGQSLKVVGVDLRNEVFSRGQLYVALSRATSASGLSILLLDKQTTTENVVYLELLFKL